MAQKDTANSWLRRYGLADAPGLSDSERSRRVAFTFGCLMGGVLSLAYFVFYFVYDLLVFDGGSLVVIRWSMLAGLAFPLMPLLLRAGDLVTFLVSAPISLALFVWATYVLGVGSGMHLFLILAISNGMIHLGASRPVETVLSAIFFVSAIVACVFLFPQPSDLVRVDETFLRVNFATVVVSIIVQMVITTRALLEQVETAEAALAAEHARSEALLRNLLPEEIAARLKDRPGEVIADGLPAVTLLFADIVDFTPRSARMPPEDLVAWLNRVFSAFDQLTAARGLEKIKTIGDAYMVAAGLPVAREDHAEVIADMALAMQAEVARLSEEMGEEVQLRIGIHSGPAIAGVIGTSKVFYDVWGDTVNTASRMESNGAPGRIQVTATSRALLEATYCFSPRGPVEIKGVGQMETWWLQGRLGAASG